MINGNVPTETHADRGRTTTHHSDLARLTAIALARAIREGDVRVIDAVEASLEIIGLLDPELHAFVTVARDDARTEAARLDALARAGRFEGPLHGVPVAIKDLVATKGMRTTKGSLRYADDIPAVDDLVVARLRKAGAVIIGKTNTPEFGFGALCSNALAGNTVNPYARDRTSGGSSGGSAVAVATGMVPLAHGTDFGGSIRTPASFCGIVGVRPGAGLVPRVPKSLPWDTLLSHGVLARTVGDAALMLSVMSGGDDRDPVSVHARPAPLASQLTTNPADVRIALSVDLGIAEIDAVVADMFLAKTAAIKRIFSRVTETSPDLSGAKAAFETLRAAFLYHELGALLDADGPPFSETVRWNVERGRNISARQLLAAEAKRGEIYQRCIDFFGAFDILVTVSASVPPFPLDQDNVHEINGRQMQSIIDYLTITYVISLVGLPAISLPCGYTDDGLPVGLQIISGPRQESLLLQVASYLEEHLSFRHEFPTCCP